MRWLMDSNFGGINGLVAGAQGATSDTIVEKTPDVSSSVEALRPATPSTREPSPALSCASSHATSSPSPAPPTVAVATLRRMPTSENLSLELVEDIVEQAFRSFCEPRQGMDCKSFKRLCKKCRLVDEERFKAADVELVFARAAQRGSALVSHRRLSLQQFETALVLVAEKKRVDALVVLETLARACSDDLTHAAAAHGNKASSQSPSASPRQQSLQPASQVMLTTLFSAISSLPQNAPRVQATPMAGPASRALLRSRSEPRVRDMGDHRSTRTYAEVKCSNSNLGNFKSAAQLHVSPRSDVNWMERIFARFCSSKHGMDSKDFERLCHHCLLESRTFAADEVFSVFSEVLPRGQLHIDRAGFEWALHLLAKRQGLSEESVLRAVRLCAGAGAQAAERRGRGRTRVPEPRAASQSRSPLLA